MRKLSTKVAIATALLLASTQAATAAPAWTPAPGATWQYQLAGTVNTGVNAQVFDVDLYETPAATVAKLHSLGRKVICYISAGSAENFRPDYASFPKSVLGKSNGWPGEKWLDIRQISILKPIMAKRLDLCKSKGFDAVEADNIDGFSNSTGFPITAAQQIAYNKTLAWLAHSRGLSIGLKNDVEQATQLQPFFDFAITEQCFQYKECGLLAPFTKANKAVFVVEYKGNFASICSQSKGLHFSTIFKKLSLDAYLRPCQA